LCLFLDDEDKKSIEREIFSADMIPESPTHLTFWEKFLELQIKMLVTNQVSSMTLIILRCIHNYKIEKKSKVLLDVFGKKTKPVKLDMKN